MHISSTLPESCTQGSNTWPAICLQGIGSSPIPSLRGTNHTKRLGARSTIEQLRPCARLRPYCACHTHAAAALRVNCVSCQGLIHATTILQRDHACTALSCCHCHMHAAITSQGSHTCAIATYTPAIMHRHQDRLAKPSRVELFGRRTLH